MCCVVFEFLSSSFQSSLAKVYYEAKAKRLRDQRETSRGGVHNDGYDDQNYDYLLQTDEILNDRYVLKHRMGKVRFLLVVGIVSYCLVH